MNTVVTSILTSAVVSLFTFVLGLKSGKNQADRAFLQELYKKLYAHFSELEIGLKEKHPKRWEDYERVDKGNTICFYPPVRKMEKTGDILYLQNRIAKQASQLEIDCLCYESNVDDLCKKIHKFLVQHQELYKGELIDETYDKQRNPMKKVKTSNPDGCKTYRNFSYGTLADKEKVVKLLNERDSVEEKYSLSFYMRGNPPEREFIICPGSLAVDNDIFATKVSEYANNELNSVAVEKDLLKRITKLKKKLAKRAKNPTGFWETFAGAFIDIFH